MRTSKVHIREKKMANNMIGYLLDYSLNGIRKQETLKGLKSYSKPKSYSQREQNKNTQQVISKIENERETQLLAKQYGNFIDFNPNAIFVKFMMELASEKTNSNSSFSTWKCVIKHINEFHPKATFENILNRNWQERFKQHLLSKVKQNSAQSYFSKFMCAVNQAYNRDQIHKIVLVKGIPNEEVKMEYLTYEEIISLKEAQCDNLTLKGAFLFSCLTGLRFSDVTRFTWRDVSFRNGRHYINFRQLKTNYLQAIPIRQDAISLMGDRLKNDIKVFGGLKYSSNMSYQLQRWMLDANITKKITFHCSRHTYAYLSLSYGVELFTLSKMLGHKNIKTTMCYAKFDQKMQNKAVDALPTFGF